MDPGTDRERDADGADDRVSLVKGLDLDLHLREVLFCAPDDDVPVAPVAEAHDDKGVDLGEHFLVDVLGLLGHDAEPDAELPSLHGALAEDLGGGAAGPQHPLGFFDGDEHFFLFGRFGLNPELLGRCAVGLHDPPGDHREHEEFAPFAHAGDVDEDDLVVVEVAEYLRDAGAGLAEEFPVALSRCF